MIFNTLFLIQYCTLNGWLIHRYFLREKDSSWLETLTLSILLSLALNSIFLYLFSQLFDDFITRQNIIILSLGLTGSILILASITSQQKTP